ncbi:MAG: hypothetical protein KDJ76_10525 [Xanthobacteraceae bacterium]|nr:hypothetical protein [Xanthobacteraceae bacterium]
MTLHRDIFWLGCQWAVTGLGIQAVDRKLEGQFDIETSRIWEDDLAGPMLGLAWFDADDFTEALAVARRRAREPTITFHSRTGGER